MSDYITLAKIKAGLPDEITAQLLDDDGAGTPDSVAWAEIVTAVTSTINGKIGQRYALPLTEPFPDIILDAAFVLAAELLYQRRGYYNDQNPWSKRADGIRGTKGQKGGQPGLLDDIASGVQPLTPDIVRKQPSVSVISEPARSVSAGRRLSV